MNAKIRGETYTSLFKIVFENNFRLKNAKRENKSIYKIFKRKTLRKIGNHKKILNKQKRVKIVL